MLKKLSSLLLASAVLTMVACTPTATPGAADADSTTGDSTSADVNADVTVSSITKAQYQAILSCAMNKSEMSAEAKVGFENIKASVEAIPDAQWNVIASANPAFSTQLQLALQNGCSI